MGSYNYTISIGRLGEQLTLNQWVLGSSPRWCTKKRPVARPGVFVVSVLRGGSIVRVSNLPRFTEFAATLCMSMLECARLYFLWNNRTYIVI